MSNGVEKGRTTASLLEEWRGVPEGPESDALAHEIMAVITLLGVSVEMIIPDEGERQLIQEGSDRIDADLRAIHRAL